MRQKKQGNIIVQQIVNVSHDRSRKDVGTLKQALERAESAQLPNRYKLYDLYHDVLSLDGHLSGLIGKRTKAVAGRALKFLDSKGGKVDAMDKLIDSTEFRDLVEELMNTIYWGATAIEFTIGGKFSFTSIDRRHLRPEKREIALSQYDTKGIPADTLPYVWMIGKPYDLGRLLQCSMYALYKRSGFGDFAQYVEIFGQPVRVVKYDAYDRRTQEELRKALDESGSSLVMMIPKQADFQMLDGKTSNGNGELQERLIKICNEEMSVAILGNTETTTSSSSSGYAQAEIHAEQQGDITADDMRYVLNLLNSDYFMGILASYGYPVEGGCFAWVSEQDLAKLKARLDIDQQVAAHVPVSDDYWYETYGIPKPENYDELVRRKEEQRQAALEAMRGTDGKDGKEDEDDKRKKLIDRITGFFAAPLAE